MHELSVTESLLEITLRHAQQAQAGRVTDLHLVIGQLSSIVNDSVQFYWDIISQGTLAEGARLHFRRIPVELLCLDCNTRYSPGDEDLACPACQSTRIKVIAGDEFYLDSIEVE
ncbi:MAG: hydrogenase maturation nickel metallochaperone HypA [Chloroflexota bacterium]